MYVLVFYTPTSFHLQWMQVTISNKPQTSFDCCTVVIFRKKENKNMMNQDERMCCSVTYGARNKDTPDLHNIVHTDSSKI